MASEKMRYIRKMRPREALYGQSWSAEDGESSLRVSRDENRVYVAIAKESFRTLEVDLSRADVADLIRALERVVRP
jgi:hypothetical protein